jgi:ferritin-like metal-binding protein YciE
MISIEFHIENIEHHLERLEEMIHRVDDLADQICGQIQGLHDRGARVEAERLRQLLEVWHCFGQMSPDGPII